MKRLLALALLAAVSAWAADELNFTAGWTYNKAGRKRILSPASDNYDVSGDAVIENVQSIATNASGEALLLGDVTNPGFAWFQNLDASNIVEVGCWDATSNFVAFVKLNAGEKAACFLATAAPRALAYTNAVNLEYVISDR